MVLEIEGTRRVMWRMTDSVPLWRSSPWAAARSSREKVAGLVKGSA